MFGSPKKPPIDEMTGFYQDGNGEKIVGYEPGPVASGWEIIAKTMTPAQQASMGIPRQNGGYFVLDSGRKVDAVQTINQQQNDTYGKMIAGVTPQTMMQYMYPNGLGVQGLPQPFIGSYLSPSQNKTYVAPKPAASTYTPPAAPVAPTQTPAEKANDDLQKQIQAQNDAAAKAEQARADAAAKAESDRQAAIVAKRQGDESAYSTGRQGAIDEFTNSVNAAYGGFDDKYYDQFSKDFEGYYLPQIGTQYDNAVKKLDTKYAESGTNNNAYSTDLGALLDRRTQEEAKVHDNAAKAATDFRGTVDSTRQSSLGDALNPDNLGPDALPGDASDVQFRLDTLKGKLSPFGTAAQQKAQGIKKPDYSALSDLFADLTQGPAFAPRAPVAAADNLNFNTSGLYQPQDGKAARVIS